MADSKTTTDIIPDVVQAESFMERDPVDEYELIRDWVVSNVHGVDPEKFASELQAIRDRHIAELEAATKAIEEAAKTKVSPPE